MGTQHDDNKTEPKEENIAVNPAMSSAVLVLLLFILPCVDARFDLRGLM